MLYFAVYSERPALCLTRQKELKRAHIQAEFGVDGCGLGDLTQASDGLGKEDVDDDRVTGSGREGCQAGLMRALRQGIESVGPHEEIECHCLDANVNSGCLKYFSSRSRKERRTG